MTDLRDEVGRHRQILLERAMEFMSCVVQPALNDSVRGELVSTRRRMTGHWQLDHSHAIALAKLGNIAGDLFNFSGPVEAEDDGIALQPGLPLLPLPIGRIESCRYEFN